MASRHTWPELEAKQRWQHSLLVAARRTSLRHSNHTAAQLMPCMQADLAACTNKPLLR